MSINAEKKRVAKIFFDVLASVDNWDPTGCDYEMLEAHYADLESIVHYVDLVHERVRYIQGVLNGRFGERLRRNQETGWIPS